MLTWALCWLISKKDWELSGVGTLILGTASMDVLMVIVLCSKVG